ncbi:MAG: glutathione S-transferase C-terminal domain-containing protein [Pseudoxanthomonas sp.]
MSTVFPEKTVEQTDDGAFRRQSNRFTARFGAGPDRLPVEAGRYRLLVSASCGWSRRILSLLRLLGLQQAISVGYASHRGDDGWLFAGQPGGVDAVLGVPRLNDLYRQTDPEYGGRGTVPTLVDLATGRVVSNDYHTLPFDLETAWAPLHGPQAPDLYPQPLRASIDLLNQQIFDDVNNGPYKVIFARSATAARVAQGVFEARLAEYDHRLSTRRYLFGPRITDADVRLFQTLLAFDTVYRPIILAEHGPVAAIGDFPQLWAYARELFATPGFVDEVEKQAVGLAPWADGRYRRRFGSEWAEPAEGERNLVRWQQAHGRESLGGSPLSAGPGAAGTEDYWAWLDRPARAG